MSVDPADDRLAQLLELQEQLDEQMSAQVALALRLPGVERAEVGAGAERPVAGAGEDNDADLRLIARPLEGAQQVGEHAAAQGVALVGPVEGDCGSVPGGGDNDVLELGG